MRHIQPLVPTMNVPSIPPRKMSLLEQVEPSTGSGLLFVTNGMNLLAFAMVIPVVAMIMPVMAMIIPVVAMIIPVMEVGALTLLIGKIRKFCMLETVYVV